jgi:hypothetical protein
MVSAFAALRNGAGRISGWISGGIGRRTYLATGFRPWHVRVDRRHTG